jgi:division protein CdvB (Snf7/Vps24/ESCRT-III family)
MYAQKESLAIDGKAMYFGGRCWASDLRLRPSNAKESAENQPRISRIHTDKAKLQNLKIKIFEKILKK